MTEKPGKSRRRFLADLLFLGGGVTAASLLAKSTLFNEQQGTPDPAKTPDAPISDPVQTRGEVAVPQGDYIEPQADGNMVLPEEPVPKEECPPVIRGRMKMPESEPPPIPAGAPPPPPTDR